MSEPVVSKNTVIKQLLSVRVLKNKTLLTVHTLTIRFFFETKHTHCLFYLFYKLGRQICILKLFFAFFGLYHHLASERFNEIEFGISKTTGTRSNAKHFANIGLHANRRLGYELLVVCLQHVAWSLGFGLKAKLDLGHEQRDVFL